MASTDLPITSASTADPDPPARATVLVVAAGAEVRKVRLPEVATTLVIGRASNSDVVIADKTVSRQHARLHLTGRPAIEDLGSKHGTFVGGRRLAANERVLLVDGMAISLGSALLLLQPATAEAPLEEPRPPLPPGVVCVSPAMQNLFGLVASVAPSELSVLLLGETGAGKEVLASAIHAGSRRRDRPLVAVNCATLSGSLLESELFGHEKGAFTGATAARAGVFEAAHGGTLLLDEVGDLPLDTQVKLLRVIERREVTRLGSTTPRPVDLRLLAATSKDVLAMMRAGAFRPDLYFRLNGLTVVVPPLRDRREDVVPLALATASRLDPGATFDASAIRALEEHRWPGNVRELRRAIERAVVFAKGRPIRKADLDLGESVSPPAPDDVYGRLREKKSEAERAAILSALEKAEGNQTRAAELLGYSRRTLVTKLAQFDIPRPRKR